jgi:hypothetical protein
VLASLFAFIVQVGDRHQQPVTITAELQVILSTEGLVLETISLQSFMIALISKAAITPKSMSATMGLTGEKSVIFPLPECD